jgi:hypothetical protein
MGDLPLLLARAQIGLLNAPFSKTITGLTHMTALAVHSFVVIGPE